MRACSWRLLPVDMSGQSSQFYMFCGENVWLGLQADEEGNGLLAALF